jgi:hypothetical protein|tara:strand:+ start:2279 stop:2428 length:150 start_codon:yes stop_codon:yes gene_type:complete
MTAEQEDFKAIDLDFRSRYTPADSDPPADTSLLLAMLEAFFFLPPDIRR